MADKEEDWIQMASEGREMLQHVENMLLGYANSFGNIGNSVMDERLLSLADEVKEGCRLLNGACSLQLSQDVKRAQEGVAFAAKVAIGSALGMTSAELGLTDEAPEVSADG